MKCERNFAPGQMWIQKPGIMLLLKRTSKSKWDEGWSILWWVPDNNWQHYTCFINHSIRMELICE